MGQCIWCCHHTTSHCESSPGSSDECRSAPGVCQFSDQANRHWAKSPPV